MEKWKILRSCDTSMGKTVLDLRIGEHGVIKDVQQDSFACKLLTLGITPDTSVCLVRKSPLGSALCLKIGETYLAIRKKEALSITLK